MSTRPTPTHRTPVRSEPIEKALPRVDPGMVALAIVLLFFGALAWIVGGRYTIMGWVDWLTRFSRWIGLDVAIPMPRGWLLIGLVAVVSLLYSLVELLVWKASARRQPLFWIGWLPIVATDIGSTFNGLTTAVPGDPLALRQLASAWLLALFVGLVLTFLPEFMIVGALKILRR